MRIQLYQGSFRIFAIICTVLFLSVPKPSFADQLPTITVVNPLRGPQLGLENADLLASLESQWAATKEATISATWLWQYSALEQDKLVDFATSEMKNQEFGVFLEIDKNTAEKSGVEYKGKIAWYHSDGLLLVSYDQFERQRLIDHIFQKFKSRFGYYPKSVGAWWIGAESLNYMQKKYGIIAALQCTDQFHTDAYSIWGTPWSIPYIPSITNAAIPARNRYENSLVMMQWAPRDPVQAYGPTVQNSTFSLQDYSLKNYSIDYFNYLKDIYLKGQNDQLVFGLEGGMPPSFYRGQYQEQLHLAKQWENSNKINFKTMEEFADSFRESGTIYPETPEFLTKAYNSNDQSFWIHNQNYRIGVIKRGDDINVVDIRDYSNRIAEDFYTLPNTLPLLKVNAASQLDTVRFPANIINLGRSAGHLEAVKQDGATKLMVEGQKIAEFFPEKVTFTTLDHKSIVHRFENRANIKYILKVTLLISLLIAILSTLLLNKRKLVTASWIAVYAASLYPIITSGWVNANGTLFDEKTLKLLEFTKVIPFSIDIKLFTIYQIVPILLTFLILYVVLKKLMNSTAAIIILSAGVVLILSQYNLPISLSSLVTATSSKKEIVQTLLYLYFCTGIALSLVSLIQIGRKQTAHLLTIGILVGVIFNFRTSIFTEKRVMLANFEKNALEQIRISQKNVLFIRSADEVVYRAIVPLMYRNNENLKYLTNTQWNIITKQQIDLSTKDVILVPNFLNENINNFEEEKFHLKKEFDNAQISIYSKIK